MCSILKTFNFELQSFSLAVIQRFQNINPDKDGSKINSTKDLKNELQIITLPEEKWVHWERFLTLHAEGKLINPATEQPFKAEKGFKENNQNLKREFFRHCGHFTDNDFQDFAKHLVGSNRLVKYPKVSVSKTRTPVTDNLVASDWVERRKRKKVIMQDLMCLKPRLQLLNHVGDVKKKKWATWKGKHKFTSATWDFLLSHPKAEYFRKRLRNEARLKRVTDLEDEFPEVLHMFKRFLQLKYELPTDVGRVHMRGVNSVTRTLVTHSKYKYTPEQLNLAVFDARAIVRNTPTETAAALDPFLNFLKEKLEPAITEPNVWLFILSGQDDVEAATKFAAASLEDYDVAHSTYVPSKGEQLNNVGSKTIAPDVPLLFLFKKENDFAATVRPLMRVKYDTPSDCVYYKEPAKNTEAKYRFSISELRMEFYLDILQSFADLKKNVLRIFSGMKFMMGSKVC